MKKKLSLLRKISFYLPFCLDRESFMWSKDINHRDYDPFFNPKPFSSRY